jgi:hypothetical protein
MPRQIAVEIVLLGLHRPMRMRAFAPIDTAATLGLLDRWRVRKEIAPEIAELAERLIDAIGRAGAAAS